MVPFKLLSMLLMTFSLSSTVCALTLPPPPANATLRTWNLLPENVDRYPIPRTDYVLLIRIYGQGRILDESVISFIVGFASILKLKPGVLESKGIEHKSKTLGFEISIDLVASDVLFSLLASAMNTLAYTLQRELPSELLFSIAKRMLEDSPVAVGTLTSLK